MVPIQQGAGEDCALSEVREETFRKITGIVSNLKLSREGIDAAERELAAAEGNYRKAKRGYDRGTVDTAEVKNALEALSRASLFSYQARRDFQLAMIGLDEILKMDIGEK
jgi:outer membrane protein TolC